MPTSIASTNSRGLSLPLLVAAPIALAAGWVIGTEIARIFRARVSTSDRAVPDSFRNKPARAVTEDDLYRAEVVRALLDSDRDRFDELGRPVHFPEGGSSQRQQGAAPIDLRNVDE